MDIVDSQIHSNVLGPPENLLQIMDALGISAALIDEYDELKDGGVLLPAYPLGTGGTRPIGPNAEAAALAYPERLQFLMRVDAFDPALEAWIDILSASPNLKALRVVVYGEKGEAAFSDGGFDPLFKIARKCSLPIFIFCPNSLPQLAQYARRFSDVRMIIDHCGVSFDQAVGHGNIDEALKLAVYPNVALKWAHAAVFLTAEKFPFRELDVPLKRCVDDFGPKRIMWASDYTMTRHRSNWAEALFHLRQSPALSEGDREWILGRTCRSWLQWPAPTKPFALGRMH